MSLEAVVGWSAVLYPPFLKSPVRLWHMHTGSVPQKCTHRRGATTELRSRSKGISCVWGVTTGPHVAAVSHNPKLLLCSLYRQTDGRGRGSGFNWRSLWLPAFRVWCTTQIRAWTTWQVSPVEASGQKECLDFTSTQISAIITMQNNLFLSLNGTAWRISISLSQRCLTTAFTPAGAHCLEA